MGINIFKVIAIIRKIRLRLPGIDGGLCYPIIDMRRDEHGE